MVALAAHHEAERAQHSRSAFEERQPPRRQRECAQAIRIERRWLLLDHKPLQGGLTASQAQQHSNQMTRRRQAKMPKASCRSTDPLVMPPMYGNFGRAGETYRSNARVSVRVIRHTNSNGGRLLEYGHSLQQSALSR